jgi:hypothetical protein
MDSRNRFESATTYRLVRLEYLIGLGVAMFLLVRHLGQVDWLMFALLFVYIDLVGYIPGAIAFHRSRTKRISKVYYVLYNIMHSMATQSAVALLLAVTVRPDWALLALPIHLCGDRALFGNFLKPFKVSFEPVVHPAFARLEADIARSDDDGPAVSVVPRPAVAP